MRNIKPENKDELIQHMQEKSDEELLKILTNKNEYDTDVFNAALNTATERNLADAEIDTKPQKEQDEKQWHYEIFSKKQGPVSKTKIKELIENKDIDKYTLVWKKGFKYWTYIDQTELKELFEIENPPNLPGDNIFLFLLGRVFNLVLFFILALVVFIAGGWDIVWAQEITFFDYLLGDGGLKIRPNLLAFGVEGKYYGFINTKRFFDIPFLSYFLLFISLMLAYFSLKFFFFGMKDD